MYIWPSGEKNLDTVGRNMPASIPIATEISIVRGLLRKSARNFILFIIVYLYIIIIMCYFVIAQKPV